MNHPKPKLNNNSEFAQTTRSALCWASSNYAVLTMGETWVFFHQKLGKSLVSEYLKEILL